MSSKQKKAKSPKTQNSSLVSEDDSTPQQESCLFSSLKVIAILLIVVAGAIYLNPTTVDPSPFTLPPPPSLNVSYHLNYAESIFRAKRSLKGPESIAISSKTGVLYTGTQDGKIVKASLAKPYSGAPETLGMIGDPNAALPLPCGTYSTEPICGRPLGMELHEVTFQNGKTDDILFVIDAYYGIYQYVPSQHRLFPILSRDKPITFTNIPNLQLTSRDKVFFNDLTYDADHNALYFTISSVKLELNNIFYELLENKENGLVCMYDLNNGETSVLLHGLAMPNGIIYNSKTKMVYVSELGRSRLLQINVDPRSKHFKFKQSAILISNLPLLPDNLALIGDDELWVAGVGLRLGDALNSNEVNLSSFPWDLPFTRDSLYSTLLRFPKLRKLIAKAVPMQFSSMFTQSSHGGVLRVKLDFNKTTKETKATFIELMVASTDHKNYNIPGISTSIASVTPYHDPSLPKHQIHIYFGGYSPSVSSIGRMTWDLKEKKPVLAQNEQARRRLRQEYRYKMCIEEGGDSCEKIDPSHFV